MVGKSQIYAEELRGQLGERLPGAIQAMSRAAGVDTPTLFKMMEDGELKAEDVFPKFSEELMKMANSGDALEKAMNNTAASIGRFKTNVWLANKTFNESGYDRAVRNFFNTTSDAIMRAEPLWEALGKAAEYVGFALAAPIELFGVLSERLPIATEFIKENAAAFKLAAGALFVLLRPFRRLVMLTMVLPLGLMAISDLIQNWNRDRSWEEWALQIGLAVTAVGMLTGGLWKLLRAGRAVGKVFGSGASKVAGGAKPGPHTPWSPYNTSGARGATSALKFAGKGLGGGLGVLGLGMMIPDAVESVQDSYFWRVLANGESMRDIIADKYGGPANDGNLDSIINGSLLGSYGISKRDSSAPQINGDININVSSPDAALAGTKVEEAINNIFRTASGSEQVTEK